MPEFEVTPGQAAEFLKTCKAEIESASSGTDMVYFEGLRDAISWLLGYDGNPFEV